MRPATLTIPIYPIPRRPRPHIPPLAADDPRHGTYAGAVAHWQAGEKPSVVCPSCCKAGSRRRKGNSYRATKGQPARVPVLGYRRRVRALNALGWSVEAIANQAGIPIGSLYNVLYSRRDLRHRRSGETIGAATAYGIITAYDRLSMRIPDTKRAGAVRAYATRNQWPPPLAWEHLDIDNPGIEPWGWNIDLTLAKARAASAAARAAKVPPPSATAAVTRQRVLEDAIADGVGISEAVRRVGSTRSAIQKWCGNKGLHHLYRELAARENGMRGGSNTVDPGTVHRDTAA